MPPNFPAHTTSLHDIKVWESLPEDVRASILRLHSELIYEAYELGRRHQREHAPEYNFRQVCNRVFYLYYGDASRN
jgi:hypothetical protein